MNHPSPLLALLVMPGLAPSLAAASQDPAHSWDSPQHDVRVAVDEDGTLHMAGEVLVTLRGGADPVAAAARFGEVGFETLGAVEPLGLLRLRVPTGETAVSGLGALAGHPDVRTVELNGLGQGGGMPMGPDDTHYGEQWHLANTGSTGGTPGADIEAEGAWALSQGDTGVVVAVLDTGIDFSHPEFVGRTVPGYDYVNEDPDATADHPHGIRVAGLLGANTDNAFGTAGVDRGCTIMPVKVLNAGNGGTTFDLIQGVNHCTQERVDVVCMSLINFPGSSSLQSALNAARQSGCILVSCGSNSGGPGINWPGRDPNTIAIAASTHLDRRASFSSWAPEIDFIAPGDDLATTNSPTTDTFRLFSGCSAATPVAAGIVSLMLARHRILSQDQAYELLRQGAEDQVGPATEDTPGRDDFFGHGRLNARASLELMDISPGLIGYDCTPAAPNSTGAPGRMELEGSSALVRDDLTLRAVSLPAGQPGLFVMGDGNVQFTPPSSASPLCMAGARLVRIGPAVLFSDASGSFTLDVLPSAVGGHGAILAGETWIFQAWHRDVAGTSNLTDAVGVSFF